MKQRFIIFTMLLMAFAVSCAPQVDDNLPDSRFYLLGTDGKEIVDAVFYDMQAVGKLKVNAYLGGFNGTSGQVGLIADDEVLLKYNETHGESYMFLPEEYFTIPEETVRITPEARSATFVCEIDCEGLRNLEDLEDYLLPLSLVSDDLPLNPDKKSICYRFSVRDLVLSMNNPGVEEVHITTGLDPVKSVPVSVVTDGDLCTVDYDYQLYYLDGSAQGAGAGILEGLFGYGRMIAEDAYSVTSDFIIREGKKEAVSMLNLDIAKLPQGISYVAIALDDDDFNASEILSKTKVYRIFKDAQILPRDGWSVPYSNVFAKGWNDTYGTHILLDGDLTTIWQAPWNEKTSNYDEHYDKWDGCVWERIASNYARLPMFCILDMAQTKSITGVKISRRQIGGNNWAETKTGEIWVSTDSTGDGDLTASFGNSLKGYFTLTEKESRAWNGKKFTKVAEFDFVAANNNLDQELTVYFEAVQARYVKVLLTDEAANPILALSEINVVGK